MEYTQVVDLQKKKPTSLGWLFCCLVDIWSELRWAKSSCFQRSLDKRVGKNGLPLPGRSKVGL
jgi:hypothetical protein